MNCEAKVGSIVFLERCGWPDSLHVRAQIKKPGRRGKEKRAAVRERTL